MVKFMDKEIDFIYNFKEEQTIVCVDKVVLCVLDSIMPESILNIENANESLNELFGKIVEFIHRNNNEYGSYKSLLDVYLSGKWEA